MKTKILAGIVFVAVAAVFIICTALVKSNKKFKVVHFDKVEQTQTPDGRYVAGGEEVYQVQISPSLAWEKGDGGVSAWRVIAFIIIGLLAVYAALAAFGLFDFNMHLAWVILAIAGACYFAAYSSAFANNYKEVSAAEYQQVKGNPAALKALFDKPLIK